MKTTIKPTALFQQLELRVHRLYAQYQELHKKRINAKFDRSLFTEDNQPFDFYFAQIKQTLARIADIQNREKDNLNFLTQKLLAQCTALSEAIATKPSKSAVKFKPVLSSREQRKQEIHQLPPRERLVKYYEALQALNKKIEQLSDLHKQALDVGNTGYAEQLKITKERRQRCLEAIELLEEYLAFKENQDNPT